MAAEPLRVLLIQSWVVPGSDTRTVLTNGGYIPHLYRVDFESGLAAALSRGTFDVVILDVKSSGISRSVVEAHLRDHGLRTPVIELTPGCDLAASIRAALACTRN